MIKLDFYYVILYDIVPSIQSTVTHTEIVDKSSEGGERERERERERESRLRLENVIWWDLQRRENIEPGRTNGAMKLSLETSGIMAAHLIKRRLLLIIKTAAWCSSFYPRGRNKLLIKSILHFTFLHRTQSSNCYA